MALRLAAVLCLFVLGACAERREESQGPALRAFSGLGALPAAAFDGGFLGPEETLDAFRGLAGDGVQAALLPGAEEAVLLLRVALGDFEPLVLGDEQRLTAASALRQVQILVGSGFVSEVNALAPVGLLQIDGRVLSPIQPHGYTRILGVGPGRLGVVGHRDYHSGMYDSALQAGPGVVEKGLLDISERDLNRPRYLRAFVATCGEVAVVGASLGPIHLFTLGQRLLAWFGAQGLDCDEVVNLAGDREAVLALSAADGARFAYVGHPLTAKAALLGFRRRDASAPSRR